MDTHNEFDKVQLNIMDRDDLDKFVRLFKEGKGSAIQVMKDEIAEDENNHFIVENRKLRETLQECLEWFNHLSEDNYSLYNDALGIIQNIIDVLHL